MAAETQASAANNADGDQGGSTPQDSQVSPIDQLDGITDLAQLESILNESANPRPEQSSEEEQSDEEDENFEEEEADEADEPEGDLDPEEEPENSDDQQQPGEEKPAPRNFRFHTKDPKRAQFLRLLKAAGEDANPVDVARLAGYTLPEAKALAKEEEQSEQTQAENPFKDAETAVSSLEAEIAAKTKEANEAAENFEWDKARKLDREVNKLELDLRDAKASLENRKSEHAEQTEAQAVYNRENAAAVSRAVSRYPETKDGKSRHAQLTKMLVALKEQSDPDFFTNPDYPNLLIDELERTMPEVFNKKTAKASARNVTPTNNGQRANVPNKAARPIGKGVPANRGSQTPHTAVTATKAIENMSLEELERLSNAVGSRRGDGGNMVTGYTG